MRKYQNKNKHPGYKVRPQYPTKLDSYKEYLQLRVKSARPAWLPAVVLFEEIRLQGYSGGITQLRKYLLTLKPKVVEQEVVRFETQPGEQMQVDWIEFRKGKNFLAAFVATLGYSRHSCVVFVTDEQFETLIECHKIAFDWFGGVPRQVLYDNMKTVILERDTYGPGKHRFHAGMIDFAHHCGFQLGDHSKPRAK